MTSKYPYVLVAQIAMITADIMFNALSVLCYGSNMMLLLIYILQNTFLIMSALVLFVSFTATFVFQLGLITIILFTFLPTMIVSIIYIFISIGYHYASLISPPPHTTIAPLGKGKNSPPLLFFSCEFA
uniref:Transmembrane protein 138 n=2 Tax=Caenorhabditis japonica TaxID=281687 RepID=A0A8R1ITW7_CAEJA